MIIEGGSKIKLKLKQKHSFSALFTMRKKTTTYYAQRRKKSMLKQDIRVLYSYNTSFKNLLSILWITTSCYFINIFLLCCIRSASIISGKTDYAHFIEQIQKFREKRAFRSWPAVLFMRNRERTQIYQLTLEVSLWCVESAAKNPTKLNEANELEDSNSSLSSTQERSKKNGRDQAPAGFSIVNLSNLF